MNDDVTVFVVDDDPAVCESLCWLLESDGWHVESFPSGEEFLACFDPRQAACLILDLHMPEMNGLAVQRRLAERGCDSPIIFVTAYGEVATCVRAMQQGAFDFLEKPVDGDRLLRLVRESLKRNVLEATEELSHHVVEQRLARLSAVEKQVLTGLLGAKPIETIAGELGLGKESVVEYRAAVLEKCDVQNEIQLLRFLVRRSPDPEGHAPF